MTMRRPLVSIAGRLKQLPANDALPGDGQASLTYASTLTISCSTDSVFDLTLTGNITIDFGSPMYDGQKIILRIKQDGTGSRLVTLGSSIRLGTDLTGFTATTTANKTDVLGFIYHLTDNKFDLVAVSKGY